MNLACWSVLVHIAALFGAEDAARVLVTVNGKSITAGDVEFAAITSQVKPDERAAREPQLVERLIELGESVNSGRGIPHAMTINDAGVMKAICDVYLIGTFQEHGLGPDPMLSEGEPNATS